jgi:hypothetical protein
MKFGKGLLQEILQSNPEWAPFWLNYKILKKRIKAVTRAAHHAASQRDICTPLAALSYCKVYANRADITACHAAESELEVAFFRDLQVELQKISLFYAAEEKRCSFRYQQLHSVLKHLKVCGCLTGFTEASWGPHSNGRLAEEGKGRGLRGAATHVRLRALLPRVHPP